MASSTEKSRERLRYGLDICASCIKAREDQNGKRCSACPKGGALQYFPQLKNDRMVIPSGLIRTRP